MEAKGSRDEKQIRTEVIKSGVLDGQVGWQRVAEMLWSLAQMEFGETSGKGSRVGERETWWWNQEVQEKLKDKKEAKKIWDTNRDDESKVAYNTANKLSDKLAKARNVAYEKLYQRLETNEGVNELFKIAKQRDRQSKDVQQVRVIKSDSGEVMMEEEKVKQRWKEYFDNLLNQENPREQRTKRGEQKREKGMWRISPPEEVRAALRRIKKGKAQGPDEIPVEAWIALGDEDLEFLVGLFNRLLRGERMPEEWRRSVFVPLYKSKGDIKERGNYRGIKLMRPHYEIVAEGNRSEDKEGGDDSGASIWVHAGKEYH